MTPLLFALDYDGTYTRAPGLFREFVRLGQAAGHRFVCITARGGPDLHDAINPEREPALPEGVAVHYTQGKPKRAYAQAAGLMVSVWVDDMPESVGGAMLLQFDDE